MTISQGKLQAQVLACLRNSEGSVHLRCLSHLLNLYIYMSPDDGHHHGRLVRTGSLQSSVVCLLLMDAQEGKLMSSLSRVDTFQTRTVAPAEARFAQSSYFILQPGSAARQSW